MASQKMMRGVVLTLILGKEDLDCLPEQEHMVVGRVG